MKKIWPAPQRNAAVITSVLDRVLPPGLTLEIASGTGQHAAHFCAALPKVQWQPSDYDASALPSIDAWRLETGLANFLPAVQIDVGEDPWPVLEADAIFCANMIHISPWDRCLGLFRGAGRLLSTGGVLVLYGPFRERDVETAQSNENFDESLKSRNPEWGLRYLHDVEAAANECGLQLEERVVMPANNLCAVFRR